MNATKNITSNSSANKTVEKNVTIATNVTKAVNITKNDTQVALKVQQKSKAVMKSKLHAAVQNMKNSLQPTNEVKDTTQKKPDQKKMFTNRENVGRSMEDMIKNLEGSIVDDKPALQGNKQSHSVFNITLSHSGLDHLKQVDDTKAVQKNASVLLVKNVSANATQNKTMQKNTTSNATKPVAKVSAVNKTVNASKNSS